MLKLVVAWPAYVPLEIYPLLPSPMPVVAGGKDDFDSLLDLIAGNDEKELPTPFTSAIFPLFVPPSLRRDDGQFDFIKIQDYLGTPRSQSHHKVR